MADYMLCPKFEAAFELLGKRWTGLIIHVLLSGSKRFKDISDIIPGVSDRMLSERFKELETAGIIVRHVYPETPVRIEYELTEKGMGFHAVMHELQLWAEKWTDDDADDNADDDAGDAANDDTGNAANDDADAPDADADADADADPDPDVSS